MTAEGGDNPRNRPTRSLLGPKRAGMPRPQRLEGPLVLPRSSAEVYEESETILAKNPLLEDAEDGDDEARALLEAALRELDGLPREEGGSGET